MVLDCWNARWHCKIHTLFYQSTSMHAAQWEITEWGGFLKIILLSKLCYFAVLTSIAPSRLLSGELPQIECAYLTILPQNNSQIVLRLGADVHQNSWSVGRAETKGHFLLCEICFMWHQVVCQDLCVPTGSCNRFGHEVVLDQRSRLKETPDIWVRWQKEEETNV